MTTPPIPAMREAAARACYNLDHPAGTDWWAGASITERAIYLTKAEASLAAALGVCDEIREQYGAEIQTADGSGNLSTIWRATRGDAEAYLGEPATTGRLLRRFRFTSPAEQVDTEGAPA